MRQTIQRAAEEGNIYAMLAMAYMYQTGKGIEPDADQALDWYGRSAQRGCSRAKWELCKIYREGELRKPDPVNYLKYLRQAADAGIPEARVELALHYLSGDLLPQNPAIAVSWLRAAANQKDIFATFWLGYAYQHGQGVDVDPGEAEHWYMKTAATGDGNLFLRIGTDFEYGYEGLVKDLYEAARWYKIGADMGHDRCFFSMKQVMKVLDGGRQDTPQERLNLLEQTPSAVEERVRDTALADADEEMSVGHDEEAFRDYQRAGGLGNADAMYMLAIMYHEGDVVKRNDRMGLEYLKKAALNGSSDAQLALGSIHETGRGSKKDEEEAIKCYAMAAAAGNLVGYYELSLHMQHPEIYVRNTQTIVR
ncbi:MAG: SEL1-like repeat protein [Candidatus Methanomethylophilus sp.]|nr:SEL1-like repeat protein [Methanomethylophilus sp.]MDD3233118.1 SEL1-like repeat protein [Methanomethylophilus sp.]MDD4221792.1 SEL1-like repeat protein [Methanomethylophilus sp.]